MGNYLEVKALFFIIWLSFGLCDRKPNPAPGVSRPSDLPFPPGATAGKTYDKFSGISDDQINLAATTLNIVYANAARASNASLSQGPVVFAKQLINNLDQWHPITSSINGNTPKQLNDVWDNNGTPFNIFFDVNLRTIALLYGWQQEAFLSKDFMRYVKLEDQLALYHYTMALPGSGKAFPVNFGLFMYYTETMTNAAQFFLGEPAYTPEIHSAFTNVWRFQNWFKNNGFLLYVNQCLKGSPDHLIGEPCFHCRAPNPFVPGQTELLGNGK